MALLGIHTGRAPWPFNKLEIGDSIICTDPRGPSTAHAYGASVGKVFKTKKITNKVTGEVGYKVTRLESAEARDNTRGPRTVRINGQVVRTKDMVAKAASKAPGRKINIWPFEKLAVGESWETIDPAIIGKAISAAGARNHRATLQYQDMMRRGKRLTEESAYLIALYSVKLYKIETKVAAETGAYLKVTITRLAGEPRLKQDRRAKLTAQRRALYWMQQQAAPERYETVEFVTE